MLPNHIFGSVSNSNFIEWQSRIHRSSPNGETYLNYVGLLRLLAELHKHICTLFSNFAVGVLFAGHCRPTLIIYVATSL